MVKLRPAQESDAHKLASLAQLYIGNTTDSNTCEGVLEYLQSGGDIVYVAEDEGLVIGYCCGRISRHMGFVEPIADILELFLMENYRGKGIGKQLLAAMEAEFLRHGTGRVRILVREGNSNARKFYGACGYEEYDMVMCRKDIVL